MKSLFRFLLFTVIAVSFFSCDKNRVFEKNISIDNYLWYSKNQLKFEVSVNDTSAYYNVYFNVRHASVYPYSNLWLMVTTTSPDGKQERQRVEIPLSTDDGSWFGEGMGDIWDYKFLAQQNAFFNQKGIYSFTFEQIMRQDPLPGIMDMGVRVEKTISTEDKN